MKVLAELLAESATAEFHTVLFDANPLPTFVLDREFCVIDFNAAASDFLDTSLSEVFRHRTGDLFRCSNAVETMAECGTSRACRHCGVRNSITGAFEGRRTARCFHQMELIRDGERARVDLLITAAPFTDRGQRLALLILEDVTELSVPVHSPASTRS